jgi:hypothetical protein
MEVLEILGFVLRVSKNLRVPFRQTRSLSSVRKDRSWDLGSGCLLSHIRRFFLKEKDGIFGDLRILAPGAVILKIYMHI